MEKRERQSVTRDKIVGMQVISDEGYIIGKVKELSFVVGEPDQALIIEDTNGDKKITRWSEINAAGDVLLLKSKEQIKAEQERLVQLHCPSCGAELDKGSSFCSNCGFKASAK
jgi:sporulation protein YlmC with PRC-barrel domain